MVDQLKIVAGDYASALDGSFETPLAHRKMKNDESSCISAMEIVFISKKVMVIIILIG